MNKSVKGGIILIIAGIILLLSQVGVISGQVFLFILSLGFIATYALLGGRKEYGNIGFLIPGTVLLAVALFASMSSFAENGNLNPGFFFLGLSLSFLAVFLVHTISFKEADHGGRYWPLYPAGGLLIVALLIQFSGKWATYLSWINYLWVAALIIFGIWLIYKSFSQTKK